jgi:glutamate/tyrosine decarboxylase-like PLP-dependent enzyme
MLHFLIKELWHLETKESNNGVNLFASSFVNILAMLCMRLIGRKSVTRIASAFFGRSIMFAEFNLSKP